MKRSVSQLARSPIKRKGKKGKAYDNDFTDEVKSQVRHRASGYCEIPGCMSTIVVFHHIRRRTQGGDGSVGNCLGLCPAHHDYIHANPAESYDRGWLRHGWGV